MFSIIYNFLRNIYRLLILIFITFQYISLNNKKRIRNILNIDFFTVFFTHNYGGGTLLYTNNFQSNNDNYLIVKNIYFGNKDFFYSIENKNNKYKTFVTFKYLYNLLNSAQITTLIINSFVTYYSVEKIINSIISIRKSKYFTLLYMVHDFHSICPSKHLIYMNSYCYLNCTLNQCVFTNKDHCTEKSIVDWKSMWLKLFSITNEIRTFSNSSKNIFISAYPTLNNEIISVVPHDMSYFQSTPINWSTFPLNIGIFGDCRTVIKGRNIVMDYALYAASNKITLHIFGPIRIKDIIKSKYVRYHGKYKSNEMRDIIQKNQIRAVFFPSVCPETFSYLVSELIILNIPIVCFNIGAQEEKVSKYKYGKIINTTDVFEIHNALKIVSNSYKE